MKTHAWLMVLGLAWGGAVLADVFLYEGNVSTADKKNVVDAVQARNPAEARRALLGRYPGGTILNFSAVADTTKYHWFRASLSTAEGKSASDTCLARGSGDARRIFMARHAGASFGSIADIGDGAEYSLYEASIKTAAGLSVTDIGLAANDSEARQMFLARYAGGAVTRMTKLEAHRPKLP